MHIVCTICSRNKRTDEAQLPAYKRYDAPHIRATMAVAKQLHLPFFILSGRYGLIPADIRIPHYDYQLTEAGVFALICSVSRQLEDYCAKTVRFYSEGKPSWQPYERALREAAQNAEVGFTVHQLEY